AAAGDRLFFSATDQNATGFELWITDGTSAGTSLVKDIASGKAPGLTGSTIFPLGVGRRVLFAGSDQRVSGHEYYVSDGTSAGTVRYNDWGFRGAQYTTSYALASGYVFLTADNGTTGVELYAFPAAQIGVSEAETFGTNCKGS